MYNITIFFNQTDLRHIYSMSAINEFEACKRAIMCFSMFFKTSEILSIEIEAIR